VPVLGPEDLVLCTGTLLHASLRELVEAASIAGFQAISLWPEDVERARAEGLAPADVRALIADRGLVVAELDPLLTWLSAGSLGPGAAPGSDALLARGEDAFYEIAEKIGGTTLNCAHPFPGEVDLDLAAERFAGVCDRAAEHGLQAVIEFLPWTGIPDVATAATIVERAGRPNGGVMFDTWHHFRGSNDDGALERVPGDRILAVQINSAPAAAIGDPMVESMHDRLLPGEGDVDVVRLVRILDAIGCRAPIGVEVFSDRLDALPPAEAARRCSSAARHVLERARTATR
jgi:sugar phosphate isomerase/epimerase